MSNSTHSTPHRSTLFDTVRHNFDIHFCSSLTPIDTRSTLFDTISLSEPGPRLSVSQLHLLHGLCHCFLVGCREGEGPVLALGWLEVDGADHLQVAHPFKAVPAKALAFISYDVFVTRLTRDVAKPRVLYDHHQPGIRIHTNTHIDSVHEPSDS